MYKELPVLCNPQMYKQKERKQFIGEHFKTSIEHLMTKRENNIRQKGYSVILIIVNKFRGLIFKNEIMNVCIM